MIDPTRDEPVEEPVHGDAEDASPGSAVADAPAAERPAEQEPDPAPVPETSSDDAAPAPGEDEEVQDPVVVEHEETEEDRLRRELAEAQARLRAVSKAYTDAQGEMHAFRERMENQARFKAERQAFDQVRAFFDPVQNLKRSIDSAEAEHAPLVDGLRIVLQQFMDALRKLGMEEVPGVGADFDPRVHEALAITPVADKAQDGKVLAVHADGYTVNGKVLQAAQVVVGKYQEPAGEA